MVNQIHGKFPLRFKPSRSTVFPMAVLLFAGIVLAWQLFGSNMQLVLVVISGIMFTASAVFVFRSLTDSDRVRARQTDEMLKLSRQTLACLKEGLNETSAQRVCALLFPCTDASSVFIVSREEVLGVVGNMEYVLPGTPVFAKVISKALEEGREQLAMSTAEIGYLIDVKKTSQAAIVVPLRVGRVVAGALVLFFSRAPRITETQKSIAEGFGQLISTQLAAEALKEQTKLATSMRLKALQSQINPHFLFNTINTISSLVRTDPVKARILLRDFAVFYRRVLDDSEDLIPLSREVDQVARYFSFEVARFGDERVALELDIDPDLDDLMVPPFLIQPLVENSVQHARPSEGKLTVKVGAREDGDRAIIWVSDDGVGMSEEACENILHPESSTGIGIAVANVHDRMCGYFGPGTHMEVSSVLGVGTTVRLFLNYEDLDEFTA